MFWPIKGILEEETDKQGASRYLVEWEGLDENGDPYTAEWVRIDVAGCDESRSQD